MIRRPRTAVLAALLVAVLALGTPAAMGAASTADRSNGVPDRALVQFKPGLSASRQEAILRAAGARAWEEMPRPGLRLAHLPQGRLSRAMTIFRRSAHVAFAEPDWTISILQTAAEPILAQESNIWQVAAPQAWSVTHGSPDVVVAVIDTGVDLSHPDLRNKLAPGTNILSPGAPPRDDNGHGTHVTGTIVAGNTGSQGAVGIAFGSRVMPIKAADAAGVAATSDLIRGIQWAIDHGAHVINLSLGSPFPSLALRQAVDAAWARGLVVVAAAGNEANSVRQYPAAYPNVIGVAAVDHGDNRASFSSFGTWVGVAAPGVDVISTTPTYPVALTDLEGLPLNYGALSGTSMSAPLVSGLAALIFSVSPVLNNVAVRDIIRASADPITGTGTSWRYGRINAERALQLAQQRADVAVR